MTEIESLAWSQQVLGEAGPHVRSVLPRVLAATHNRYAAIHAHLELGNAAAYGLMWLAVPRALVEELAGRQGVQVHRPPRASYHLPVINGVPLVPWRYAKDRTTSIDDVPFGHPVSETRRSLFEPLELPLELELELGEPGLGDGLLADLTGDQREELGSYVEAVRELATDGQRIAVLGYASTPEALLRGYLGYAELRADDRLDWIFREDLQLPATARDPVRDTAPSSRGAFDSGPVAEPNLRPRPPLAGPPTMSDPTDPTPGKTGTP
ncbi:MAG: hypothetical protein ACR2GH_04390 [Pseudonocardia sp.]